MNPIPELLPGDHLLYKPTDLVGWIIAVKTWSRKAVHIEVYVGDGQSYAARTSGVNVYPVRLKGLTYVLRPRKPFDVEAARKWFFNEAIGQGYDFLGLLVFYLAVRHGSRKKMYCSEFATRFDRRAGFHAMNPHFDADEVAPGDFLKSPALDWVWKA